MKARVYIRMAPTSRGFKFAANAKPSHTPLMSGEEILPTIAFALDLELPPGAFNIPVVGTVLVPDAAIHPCVEATA